MCYFSSNAVFLNKVLNIYHDYFSQAIPLCHDGFHWLIIVVYPDIKIFF